MRSPNRSRGFGVAHGISEKRRKAAFAATTKVGSSMNVNAMRIYQHRPPLLFLRRYFNDCKVRKRYDARRLRSDERTDGLLMLSRVDRSLGPSCLPSTPQQIHKPAATREASSHEAINWLVQNRWLKFV